jgi:hypothetical protein
MRPAPSTSMTPHPLASPTGTGSAATVAAAFRSWWNPIIWPTSMR